VSSMLRLIFVVLLLTLSACDKLGEFRTDSAESFQGKIVGSDPDNQKRSFIRAGFPSHLLLSLTFDPFETESDPGTITLSNSEGEDLWFSKTRLEPIGPLFRDPLTQYTFPGAGRIRNYIFSARITGQPRSALVFISLMEDGEIEARVIAPPVSTADGKAVEQIDGVDLELLFGVFRLKKVSP
jgi:hypothetical protein